MAASHGYGRTSRDDSDAEGEGAGGTTDAISGAMILNGPSSRIIWLASPQAPHALICRGPRPSLLARSGRWYRDRPSS